MSIESFGVCLSDVNRILANEDSLVLFSTISFSYSWFDLSLKVQHHFILLVDHKKKHDLVFIIHTQYQA